MAAEQIALTLIAEPRELVMSGREDFEIGLEATNLGTSVVDAGLGATRLLVDGTDSLPWSDAILNGHRESKWFALPPGDTVTISWTGLGASIFPQPGDYSLVLRLRDLESPPVLVSVG